MGQIMEGGLPVNGIVDLLLYFVHFTGSDTAVEPKSISRGNLIIIHLNCIIRARIFFTKGGLRDERRFSYSEGIYKCLRAFH